MDTKAIERLANLMKDTGLTALELTEGETMLRLERQGAPAPLAVPPAPVAPAAEASGFFAPSSPAAPQKEGTLVVSPTVGVFYAAPSPDSKPYVEVGDTVKKGDVLCVIEAMKLMNEISAEVDGTIAEVCIGNGQVVEFNQPLFRIV